MFHVKSLLALCASLAATAVLATPVTYTFSTTPGGYGATVSDGLIALLGSGPVTGSFSYDADAAFYGDSAALGFSPGYAIYLGNSAGHLAFSALSGQLGALAFSDVVGTAEVSNENIEYQGDVMVLSAETSPKVGEVVAPPASQYPRQLQGFTVGHYKLDNVRFLWGESGGSPDFLSGQTLPASLLPTGGFVLLDFVSADDPLNSANDPNYRHTVFFKGLTLQAAPVPEPHSLSLLAVGLVALAWRARRVKGA
jgi:hypothetical protein